MINTNSRKNKESLFSKLGSVYGAARGLPIPNLSAQGFKKGLLDFKNNARIPTDAKLWTMSGGLQYGALPTQEYASRYILNPESAFFKENFGGLGDTFQNTKTLNGISRQKVIDAFNKANELSHGQGVLSLTDDPDMMLNAFKGTGINSTDQIDELIELGDLKLDPNSVKKTWVTPGEGTSLGSMANIGSGVVQGGMAAKGLYDNYNAGRDFNSLKNDINLSMASNPMYDMYLTSEDEKYLRQMKNGTMSSDNWNNAADNVIKSLPSTLLQAGIGLASGGIPGAIINGIGGLVNSGVKGYGQGTQEDISRLEGIYNRLKQSEEEYRSMKRPRGLSSAGLQSRHYNRLY